MPATFNAKSPAAVAFAIKDGASADLANHRAIIQSMTRMPPLTRLASDFIPAGAASRDGDVFLCEAAFGLDAKLHAGPLPSDSVAIAGRQRVSNLVKDRVADLCFGIEHRQFPRERDRLPIERARPESTCCAIKIKAPHRQSILVHQRSGELLCGKQIHTLGNGKRSSWQGEVGGRQF